MILLDDTTARARMVWQAQVARGVDAKSLSDPDKAVDDWHTRLRQPLDTERRREAALRLIRGA